MPAPTPYLYLPGTARQALRFYAEVFGGTAGLHTLAEFGRTDGPLDAVAHGYLTDGPVTLFAADATANQAPYAGTGVMLALLGTTDPDTLHRWFARLAEGGQVVEDLAARPWGATDGRVVDQYGVQWLIGYEETSHA